MRAAFRAKRIVTLAGEGAARGMRALDAPPAFLDDAVIVAADGRIESVEPYAAFRRRRDRPDLADLGGVTLVPGLINAHCHLELAHLHGLTVLGRGFVPWLRSLIPLAARPVEKETLLAALQGFLRQWRIAGVAHAGDVGSRNPALAAEALRLCRAEESAPAGQSAALPPFPELTHFLEVFGFGPAQTGLPKALAAGGFCPPAAGDLAPERFAHAAVAGHALYSTSPQGLRAAFDWCREHSRPFSMHLAEHQEEDDCLLRASGELHDLLRQRVLPPDWQAPGLAPAAYAASLGLLSPLTLAVHAVRCSAGDIDLLRRCGASVCLCPRSNKAIGTGTAPARQMAEAGVTLCLGTDSPASNADLDMGNEMLAAAGTWGFSPPALLRMAAPNGAHALRLPRLGSIEPGKALSFAELPQGLEL